MDADRSPELSPETGADHVDAAAPPYATPEVRDYGRIQPRLQFTPPNPPT